MKDETEKPSINWTIPPQDGIKVFANSRGRITILASEDSGGEQLIEVGPAYAAILCLAIQQAARDALEMEGLSEQ